MLQSMNDGATVPLFYNKRVPEVLNQNDDLSDAGSGDQSLEVGRLKSPL